MSKKRKPTTDISNSEYVRRLENDVMRLEAELKTFKPTKYFTVGQLIKSLQESGLPPETPVWLIGMHARPATTITLTTMGDPATGRRAGDPRGSPVAVIE